MPPPATATRVDDTGRNTYNVLDVALAPGVAPPDVGVERNFYTTSSCGVCGKAALDAVRLKTRFPPDADPVTVSPAVLSGLPDTLREPQRVFDSTGGLHAAGLFTADGELLVDARGRRAGTTRSTRSWAGRCWTSGCPRRARC